MNHDEPKFEEKFQKFSIVKKCPRCNQLSLMFRSDTLICSNCGYEEKIPTIK